jgi:hypothetical protein
MIPQAAGALPVGRFDTPRATVGRARGPQALVLLVVLAVGLWTIPWPRGPELRATQPQFASPAGSPPRPVPSDAGEAQTITPDAGVIVTRPTRPVDTDAGTPAVRSDAQHPGSGKPKPPAVLQFENELRKKEQSLADCNQYNDIETQITYARCVARSRADIRQLQESFHSLQDPGMH